MARSRWGPMPMTVQSKTKTACASSVHGISLCVIYVLPYNTHAVAGQQVLGQAAARIESGCATGMLLMCSIMWRKQSVLLHSVQPWP